MKVNELLLVLSDPDIAEAEVLIDLRNIPGVGEVYGAFVEDAFVESEDGAPGFLIVVIEAKAP